MKKKCLFFDIDGTLVDEQTHQIPQSTIEALRAARRSGSVVFINTGRPYSHVSAMIKALDFDGYCCGCRHQKFSFRANLCTAIKFHSRFVSRLRKKPTPAGLIYLVKIRRLVMSA